MSFRVFKKYKSSSDQAYLLICFVSRYKKSILSSSDLKSLPYNHRAHPTQPITFLSQMKDMAKIRLFYSGTMALILPRLKDITNFVLKLICLYSTEELEILKLDLSFISVCLSVVCNTSVISYHSVFRCPL